VFCIHSSVIGANKHLLFDEQTRSGTWIENFDPSMILYTKSYKEISCLDTLLKLAARPDASLDFPAEYVNLARVVFNSCQPMWSMMLPNHVFKSAVMTFVNKVIEANVEAVMQYYKSTWAHVGHFLSQLQPITLDGSFLGTVKYDRISTRTGRMTVAAGPQVLTMSKEKRRLITGSSKAPIYYVDFRALEPTIIANAVGLSFSGDDLYAWLAENVLHNQTRDSAKKAVVSALYGDQTHRTSDAKLIAQKFDLKNFAQHIRSKMCDITRVTNVYGRLISTKDVENDGCVINDYTQSSAVDAAILGFDLICSSLHLTPLCVIHDAVIVEDVDNNLSDGFISNVIVDRVGKLYYKAIRLDI
jgi:hypothetical protein